MSDDDQDPCPIERAKKNKQVWPVCEMDRTLHVVAVAVGGRILE
jgi:hypothetical protein